MIRTPERVKTVYVVEDDPGLRALLERVLGTFYSLRVFESGREALNALQAMPPDVLVTDLHMPGLSGEELLWAVGHMESRPRLVVMSGDPSRLHRAAQWAHATVPKPFAVPALIGAIETDTPTMH